jgi:hypothetical protein
LQGSPHDQGQKAHEDVGLGSFFGVVEDGSQAEVVLAGAEGVFDLGEADVGFPEVLGIPAPQVGTQQVASVRQIRPLAYSSFLRMVIVRRLPLLWFGSSISERVRKGSLPFPSTL